ncbi:sterol desaturase family protein [Vibrio sp. 10N.261.55.A7]|uniref:sterol desaturase family protein n=1 Tax=Vibrio sp. 10N.261.55.A7 TaxID=1880851 RepID=UPI000C831A46|nr:sterol desaturase family protein [Vibrio sp. 10N.261.55.A7]PMJ92116.1 sterol desaturase [Vibrio sp. 10N.261.55.A7]
MDHELLRLVFFVLTFVLCATWEWLAPKKGLTQNKLTRWANNLALISISSILVSLLLPIVAYQAAHYAMNNGIGLFNQFSIPLVVMLFISILILDFAIYYQHVLFHRVPILWRLHRVHHADQDIDMTTGARFHPIEIILSMLIKMGVVMALGIPPTAVIVFEIILNVSAMFNHSNARLYPSADRLVRKWIVTPDMHRVHHSVIVKETHSNFGFFLSVWDRWFKTYTAQPKLGHDDMVIGLPIFKGAREQWLDKMLTQPFRKS